MDEESERASHQTDTPYSYRVRRIILRHVYYCPDCVRERDQEQCDEHYAEVARRSDPALVPGHQYATEREWREWREATTTATKGEGRG